MNNSSHCGRFFFKIDNHTNFWAILWIIVLLLPGGCSVFKPSPTDVAPTSTKVVTPTSTSSSDAGVNTPRTPTSLSNDLEFQVTMSALKTEVAQAKTPRPTPTATQIPVPIWSTNIRQPVQLHEFLGSWSPVSNALAGVLRHDQLTTGTLVYAEAPDFSSTVLDPDHTDRVLPEITFSPDGNQILYGFSPEPMTVDFVFWISGEMLRLDSKTGVIKTTGFSFAEGLSFWGWMDDQTVALTSYSGGGHESIMAWNYKTGKVLLRDTLPVYSLGAIHYPYAAVNGCETNCIAYVLLPQLKQSQGSKPCLIACRSDIFPSQKVSLSDPNMIDSFSQDWLPGTNKLLVAVRDFSGEQPKAGLVLWDVKTGQTTNVVGSGVYGKYSPDGKILIWANFGQSDFPTHAPGALALEPINLGNQTHLHLSEIASGKTLLSLPVVAHTMEKDSTDNFLDPYFTFSPDGQLITLVTPGQVQLDDINWYVETLTASPDQYYLSVIDPMNRRVLKSIEINGYVDFDTYRPVWSPESHRFVFKDQNGNWQLFDVATAALMPITQANGKLLGNPSWSFDGRYLQLVSEPSIVSGDTYIFDLPDK